MEVTWKYDVKNVGGRRREAGGRARIHPPTRKSHDGHVDLTGECDSDIYPAPQLVSRPIRVTVGKGGWKYCRFYSSKSTRIPESAIKSKRFSIAIIIRNIIGTSGISGWSRQSTRNFSGLTITISAKISNCGSRNGVRWFICYTRVELLDSIKKKKKSERARSERRRKKWRNGERESRGEHMLGVFVPLGVAGRVAYPPITGSPLASSSLC